MLYARPIYAGMIQLLAQTPVAPPATTMSEYLVYVLVGGLVSVLTGGAAWLFKSYIPSQQELFRVTLKDQSTEFTASLKDQRTMFLSR